MIMDMNLTSLLPCLCIVRYQDSISVYIPHSFLKSIRILFMNIPYCFSWIVSHVMLYVLTKQSKEFF